MKRELTFWENIFINIPLAFAYILGYSSANLGILFIFAIILSFSNKWVFEYMSNKLNKEKNLKDERH